LPIIKKTKRQVARREQETGYGNEGLFVIDFREMVELVRILTCGAVLEVRDSSEVGREMYWMKARRAGEIWGVVGELQR